MISKLIKDTVVDLFAVSKVNHLVESLMTHNHEGIGKYIGQILRKVQGIPKHISLDDVNEMDKFGLTLARLEARKI